MFKQITVIIHPLSELCSHIVQDYTSIHNHCFMISVFVSQWCNAL